MHPYLTQQDYLSSSLPYARAYRARKNKIGSTFGRWLRAAIRQRQRNRLFAEFRSMDDRMLRDMGIYRGDIRRVVDSFDDHELGMTPFSPSAERLEEMTSSSNWRGGGFL